MQAAFPPALERSKLYRERGIMLVRGLFDAATTRALLGEAHALRPGAARGSVAASDATEGRGGAPARNFISASGGALHWELHGTAQMARALARLCGLDVAAFGGGTYSYYEPGDFLALHRDVERCDLATITCLSDAAGGAARGGLVVYPDFTTAPLSAVRARGRAAGVPVALRPGDTAVLLGGIVPHEVAAVEGERVVAVMCYRLAEP